MPDIVKKYLDKIKEFWNKYSKKQKKNEPPWSIIFYGRLF